MIQFLLGELLELNGKNEKVLVQQDIIWLQHQLLKSEGETDKDEIEYWPYQINETLHDLIKDSPSDLISPFYFSNIIY